MTLQTLANRVMNETTTPEKYLENARSGLLLGISRQFEARAQGKGKTLRARDHRNAKAFDTWRLLAAHAFFYAKG